MKQSLDNKRPFLIPKINAPILILLIATFVVIDLFAMPWVVASARCAVPNASFT